MKDIQIVVKPHHLKGNSWAHGGANDTRNCPLYEALKENGYKEVVVLNSFLVFIEDNKYKIEGGWSNNQVSPYIDAANQGSDTEYPLTLKPILEEADEN